MVEKISKAVETHGRVSLAIGKLFVDKSGAVVVVRAFEFTVD